MTSCEKILRDLLDAGAYNDDGDFVISHVPWSGQGDPPDMSDDPALLAAWKYLNELPG